ncbi:MAG: GAF domain-containing sensor histidine kinase [Anaerolineaceae bacterium]|nr:MAG: GAF domain-containing sensor histidine kinase [Anaerolineaceae bacterium]
MDRLRTWAPLVPIDWINLSVRALALAALPLVAGLYGKLSSLLIYLLAVWLVFTVLISLARRGGRESRWLEIVTIAFDIGFAVAAIRLSGLLDSPLWWSLLIGPLRAGLIFGLPSMLLTMGLGLALLAMVGVVLGGVGLWALIPVGMFTGVLMIATAIVGALAVQVRQIAYLVERQQGIGSRSTWELERQWARRIFDAAANLSATLDLELVLDLALDTCAQAISEADSVDTELVSALLLFTDDRLYVASARRLDHADWRVSLNGDQGVIGEAVNAAAPRLSGKPRSDPELRHLAALRDCHEALVIPIASTLETYGVLLFAHPEPRYFSVERVELLEALTHQITIALQNAQLYRELEQEKERITEIQDEARKKLARDLHDGPTQTVAAIAMTINFARRLVERDPKAATEELLKVETLARNTTREIRHMLFTLRPLILESRGLVAALGQLSEKMHDTHRQNVIIEAEPEVADDLDLGKQGVVFYIAEEAINNARKHAEAEHIWVRLKRRGDQFVLEVEDDGVGFNVGAVDSNYEQRGSLGMVNMRERTELVNGEFNIRSSEGDGTCITVIVPLMEASVERLHQPGSAN